MHLLIDAVLEIYKETHSVALQNIDSLILSINQSSILFFFLLVSSSSVFAV